MRYVRFNFIDETFGEEVECLLIWDDEEFIIVTLDEEEIKIKKYKDMQELLVEFLTNKNELEFIRSLTIEQEKDIDELEEKIKWMENKEKQSNLKEKIYL